MKKLILAAFSVSLMLSCSDSNQNTSVTKDLLQGENRPAPNDTSAPHMEFIMEYYTGAWAGTKYNLMLESRLFTEINHSDSYHDFKITNGGSTPGYISITTVKMDSATQKPHEIANNLHKNVKGKVLGELRTEVTPEKIGENEVYLFQDKGMSGFAQDAIIICKGEAIHVKFQSQGPEEVAMAKDKEAFRTFLSSIKISDVKL